MGNFFHKLIAGGLLLLCSLAPWQTADGQARDNFARADSPPEFTDDFDRDSLIRALSGSIRYLQGLRSPQEYPLCGQTYTAAEIADSLGHFLDLLQTAGGVTAEFARAVDQDFEICQAAGSYSGNRVLVTGYYEPLFQARLEREPPYLYPLYGRPPDLVVSPPGSDGGERMIGRMNNGDLVPYWSRAEIENTGMLAGHELVYLADPLEAFILHIQGSGRVVLADGTMRRVQFAARNGRPYRSIGRFLVEQGRMRLEEVDLPRILAYLKSHPKEMTSILHHNESYIFFRWGEENDGGPLGSIGLSLTPGRSVALDPGCFPPGGLGYLETRKPRLAADGRINGWEPMKRFVVNQDSGSAIKGPGRVDFFWGTGTYAEAAAGAMKQQGRLFLLIRKK